MRLALVIIAVAVVLLASSDAQTTIKDPAEYNAYVTALNQSDAATKVQALETFLQQYPNSVVKVTALELLMATYQQLGNLQKVLDTANRVLQADPANLRALALLTYIYRQQAEAGGPNAVQSLQQAAQYAQQGMQANQTAPKPAELTVADWEKLKSQTQVIFAGAAGMAALQQKDYTNAQKYLAIAALAQPNDLRNVYPLALAYLTGDPPDLTRGFSYLAKAVKLARGTAAESAISEYGRRLYAKHFGSSAGWDAMVGKPTGEPHSEPEPVTPADSISDADSVPGNVGQLQARHIARRSFRSLVLIKVRGKALSGTAALGSGFFVTPALVVTNYHVIDGAADGCVKLVGRECTKSIAGVVAVDKANDLAILAVVGLNSPALPLASKGSIEVGDSVYAVGNPEGLEATFSAGIVSAFRHLGSRELIQITAPISHGSSGGPVLNANGQVVGVAVSTFREGQNLNFAIPAFYVRGLLSHIGPAIPLSAVRW